MNYLSYLWLQVAFKPSSFILHTHLPTQTDIGICGKAATTNTFWLANVGFHGTDSPNPGHMYSLLHPTVLTHRWLMVLQKHGWVCQEQGWAVQGAIVWSFCG